MITYSKLAWGLHLLLRFYGSAFPRALIFSGISVAITAVLFVCKHDELRSDWLHPYPYQIFAFIVGFVIVFRSNLSYTRYWEGRTLLQNMTGRWADFCTQAVVFDSVHECRPGASEAAKRASQRFADSVVHLCSLMHALALQHLRGDWDMNNLKAHRSADDPPPLDAMALKKDKAAKAMVRFSLLDLIVLRAGTMRREGYNAAMPLPVIGSVSPKELAALGMGMERLSSMQTETLLSGHDYYAAGASQCCPSMSVFFQPTTGMYTPGAAERVNVVYAWLQQQLQERLAEGGLALPAPIASRMWQMLSEGYIDFEGCRKLADTPFPFPWAQMILLFLLMFALTVPVLIIGFVHRLWLALLLDFICVQAYWALNEVARDIEDPFILDPNDLPLARLQFQFNERLIAAARTRRPEPPPDSLASTRLAPGVAAEVAKQGDTVARGCLVNAKSFVDEHWKGPYLWMQDQLRERCGVDPGQRPDDTMVWCWPEPQDHLHKLKPVSSHVTEQVLAFLHVSDQGAVCLELEVLQDFAAISVQSHNLTLGPVKAELVVEQDSDGSVYFVLVECEVPDSKVLLSGFHAWTSVVNFMHPVCPRRIDWTLYASPVDVDNPDYAFFDYKTDAPLEECLESYKGLFDIEFLRRVEFEEVQACVASIPLEAVTGAWHIPVGGESDSDSQDQGD
ncbi:hypothetical protein WJX72_004682 [[Myrmecia] bisecta]|uniref:Uncharacterized protein n=1 Tax=[Myrmecia] bisecta TaxID=41462 RepID=A0AAW1PB24_9CHLO